MKTARPVLVIAGVTVGMIGLGALVFARLFQWAAEQRHSYPHR